MMVSKGAVVFIAGCMLMFSGVVLLAAVEELSWKLYSILQLVTGIVLVFMEVIGW